MSRCFPYPPQGFVRNPVAVAEAETTAKLQKERVKAEKKEKRSHNKSLQQDETSKHSKHSHKRKHEDSGIAGQESKTSSKESVEQLEKSGLSEEHGAPFFVQTVRNSPESSQDSSKRRKVVLPSHSQAKNGNILRIKIKRDQDSPRGVEQPSLKQIGLGSSQLSKPNSILQQNKVNANANSAATAHQLIGAKYQSIQKQASTQPSKSMRDDQQMVKVVEQKQASTKPPKSRRDDQQMVKVVQQIDTKLSVHPPVGRADLQHAMRVDPPHVKMAQRDLPSNAVPAKVLQRVEPQVPSAEIQRKCPPLCQKVSQEVSIPVIPHVQPPVVSKEEPSSSGRRNAEAVQGKETKLSKSDRKKSRKAEKKEKKFRDLFVTWNPPSFEMEDSDVCAQDWLFGSTRNSDASITSCRASDGSVPFQSMEQQPSLLPRATFLPDIHIYQLPYVVPF